MKKSLLALSLAALATSAFAGTVYEHKDDNGASSKLDVYGDLRVTGTHAQTLPKAAAANANQPAAPAAAAPAAKKAQFANFRARLGLHGYVMDQYGLGLGVNFRTSYDNLSWVRLYDNANKKWANSSGWSGNGRPRDVKLDYVYGDLYLGRAGMLSYGNRYTAYSYFGDDLRAGQDLVDRQAFALVSAQGHSANTVVYAAAKNQYVQTFLYQSPEVYGVKAQVSYARSNFDTDRVRDLQYAATLDGYGVKVSYAHTRTVKEKADQQNGNEGYSNDVSVQYVNSTLVDGLELGLGVNYSNVVAAKVGDNTKEYKLSNVSGGLKVNYTGFQYAKPYAGVFAGRLTDAKEVEKGTALATPDYLLTVSPYVGFATTPVQYMDASLTLFVEGTYNYSKRFTYDAANKKYTSDELTPVVTGAFGVQLKW